MARAQRRPESRNLRFRKRVPADILALYGGPRQVAESLGTSDEGEAKRLFREVEARHEARWAEMRRGVQTVDERQAAALAGELYRELLAGNAKRNQVAMHGWTWLKRLCEEFDRDFEVRIGTREEYLGGLERLHGQRLNEFALGRGTFFDEGSRGRMLEAVHAAVKRGVDRMLQETSGDWSPDTNLARFPALEAAAPDPRQRFDAVWKGWQAAMRPAANTVRRWGPVLERMLATVGKRDLALVTEDELRAWIGALRAGGLGNNTVGKVHLAAAKCIFGYAKAEKIIAADPTADLKVSSGKRHGLKMRGFSSDEAETILLATLRPPGPRTPPTLAAARRWVPWLCAYTGARVNEMTQLRACDVSRVRDAVVVDIRSEAGTAKTGSRKVPLHEHVVEQGFMALLEGKAGDEPLFYSKRRGSAPKVAAYERVGASLGRWVRSLGLTDPCLDPNHAWRHRFRTVARKAKIHGYVIDALQGHAPGTEGEAYGEVDLETRIDAIRSVPSVMLSGT